MREAATLVPALRGYENLQPAFEINASGPADRLDVQLNVREKEVGHVAGNLVIDALGPERRIAGEAQTEHFNVGALVRGATVKTDVTGHATMDLVFPSAEMPTRGTYTMNASRAVVAGYEARNLRAKGRIDGRLVTVNADAAAYGGHATAVGTVRAEAPLTLDLEGRATNVDLRNLPPQLNVPGVSSQLQFSYTIAGRGPLLSGDVQMEESTIADATIAPGTIGSFKIGGGAPEYSAKGQVANLDLQKIGRGFNIPTLDTEKFQSRINATAFDAKGVGGGRYPLTLDATGTLVDSEIFRATVPHFEFTTNFGGGDAHVVSMGEFTGLDPAAIVGDNRVAGRVDGDVDVNLTLRNYSGGVTVDSVDATGRVNVGHSTIGGLDIDKAVVDGTYTNRAGTLNELVIDGPDFHANGKGAIALNDTGSSNLTLHLDTPVARSASANRRSRRGTQGRGDRGRDRHGQRARTQGPGNARRQQHRVRREQRARPRQHFRCDGAAAHAG